MVTVNETNREPDGTFETLEADDGTFNDSITDPEGNTVTSLSDPVRVTEEASTFTESNVTVTNSNTTVSGGSIELLSQTTTTATRPNDQDTTDRDDYRGLLFNPNKELTSIEVTVSSNSNAGTEIGVADGSSIIDSQTGLSVSAGDTFTLTGSFQTGTDYFVYLYAGGSTITIGRNSDISSYPFVSDNLDITAGVFAANPTSPSDISTVAYSFVSISGTSAAQTSGDALIEFDSATPADIKAYDLATFQETPNGETVTIDVEDGNANVLFSDIGQNFDISTVNPSKEVKLRANLSRNDTANNPTVDYLARRFTR